MIKSFAVIQIYLRCPLLIDELLLQDDAEHDAEDHHFENGTPRVVPSNGKPEQVGNLASLEGKRSEVSTGMRQVDAMGVC